jgi:molybdopterin molybdotransferase
MTAINKKTFCYQRAQQLILAAIGRLSHEVVALHEAQQRITSADVLSMIPQPSFDESMRDGYILSVIVDSGGRVSRFQIIDEIPAGKPFGNTLAPGSVCRIMTGGCVPDGGTRVVPFENCVEQDSTVIIEDSSLQMKATYIRRAGSEIAQGERLLSSGTVLQAGHLALLASCGVHAVSVVAKPNVGYLCTGSELVSGVDGLEMGQKFSSNSFLLKGLLASVGAPPKNLGIINDNEQEILSLFTKARADKLDAMITTGGMGPGKYDLVERAFVGAGGKVVFNAISMRPGKSLLFGTLGRTLFFGLPGPPHAVRTLLNELVGPALLAMQGVNGSLPRRVQAYLQHTVKIKRNDILKLKDGVLEMESGRCSVRFAGRLELPNCFILLPPGQSNYCEGDMIEVHLANDLCAGM